MVYHFRHMYAVNLIDTSLLIFAIRRIRHYGTQLVSRRWRSKICGSIIHVLLIRTIRRLKLYLFPDYALLNFRITLVSQGLFDQILQVNFLSE